MASFRKRNGKWQVQVRRLGHPPITRSFIKKADADTWARQIENQLDRSDLPVDPKQLRTITLGDLLKRYRDTVTVKKRGVAVERMRIDKIIRHEIGLYCLSRVTPSAIASYRDERLRQVKPETIRRELTILRHLFEVARKDWGLRTTSNPVAQITKPAPGRARERRLQNGEYEKLLTASERSRSKQLPSIVKLAIETGMRRGELLAMRWDQINLENSKLHIPDTKNGVPRTIPLSSRAIEILRELPRKGERVFSGSGDALRQAWENLRERAGIENLHFHDLRHEAISRFFERGLSVPEVALISGHRDVRQLFRYTHLRAEDVVAKLG
jgi:integrase